MGHVMRTAQGSRMGGWLATLGAPTNESAPHAMRRYTIEFYATYIVGLVIMTCGIALNVIIT